MRQFGTVLVSMIRAQKLYVSLRRSCSCVFEPLFINQGLFLSAK